MITLNNVTFRFPERPVFENLSITLPDKCALMAPSGRGKTTLLRLAAGLLLPQAGEIKSDHEKYAFLFQDDRLMPWLTAKENVETVLPRHRRQEAAYFLSRVGLSEHSDALPENLSGGQRRRVSIARLLAYGGDLFILDEPFRGLDRETADAVADVLRSAAPKILMAVHSLREAVIMGCEIVDL
ncbi:MAG: ATP-binding cassette domain-containing protein [Oscillospiraceae bacterium]|nr:ATP-binding cassette domain-containing protein [Oscillospiraceae bacterium]